MTQARADSPSLLPEQNQPASILDGLKTLPLREGFMWDYTHHRGLNTLSLGIIGYKGVGVDLSYMGVDGIGATLDYDLSTLPVATVPVLKYVQYLNIGYAVGWRTLALNPVTDNPKSDNQLIQGPVLFAKLRF